MRAALLTFLTASLVLGSPPALADDSDSIRAGYELFYRGDLHGSYQHFRALAHRDPNNLAAAYGVLSALYARDLAEEELEQEFEQRAEALLERARTRYEQNPRDRKSLFYLAQAHGLRAGYRFQRKKERALFGAILDATKSKNYSDTYVKRYPDHADAYIALGLYNYYADIAPSFLKFLRLLLFIPGGNRTEGLKQLEHAAHHGELWAPQAQMELVQIYGWLEGRLDDALAKAQALQQRYPDNPELSFRLARLYAGPAVEDFPRASEQFEAILERSRTGHRHFQGATYYHGVLGLATVRAQQWRLEEAVSLLSPVIESRVNGPSWVLPRSLLLRGSFRAYGNDPKATDDARRVLAESRWKEHWHEAARTQLEWIEARRRSGEAAEFAALIPGNRLVAEQRWELAEQFYEEVRRRQPNNWQVRYRLGRLHFLGGDWEKAEAELTTILNHSSGSQPGWLRAGALLLRARLHDLRGERGAAVELYKQIASDYDEDEQAVLAARLGLVTPYKPVKASH